VADNVEFDPRFACAVQDRSLLRRLQFAERRVEREAGMSRDRLGKTHETSRPRANRARGNGALPQRQGGITNQQRRRSAALNAETLARRTPSERAVEREVMRIERLETATALIAGIVLAVAVDLPLRLRFRFRNVGDVHDAAPEIERRFDRVGDARPLIGPHDDPIDDHFHVMLAAMIDSRRLLDVVRCAVDAQPHEPGRRTSSNSVSYFSCPFRSRGAIR